MMDLFHDCLAVVFAVVVAVLGVAIVSVIVVGAASAIWQISLHGFT